MEVNERQAGNHGTLMDRAPLVPGEPQKYKKKPPQSFIQYWTYTNDIYNINLPRPAQTTLGAAGTAGRLPIPINKITG